MTQPQTASTPAERILVTSALPYANGDVHLGHLAGAYLPADIFVRYQRSRGADVLFICGSDEHGVSIPISAQKEGLTPRDIIDRYHARNREAFARAGISFDNYSRTSLDIHHETAKQFFLDLLAKDVLKRKAEFQLYDEQAGMFLPDRYVVGTCPNCGYDNAYGDQCEKCGTYYNQTDLLHPKSLITGNAPVVRETLHLYFPLGDFQERLETYVEEHASIWKENVLQQCRSWLKAGLGDRPITRDLDWGVAVPMEGFEQKVLYVWFEAVLGYISSTKEYSRRAGDPELWKKYWRDPATRYIAFIGKDNIVFHCLMFPAMLMAHGGYVLPENVPANEFLNLEGQKFSKSRNWSIELGEFLERYPADALRYTLALNLPETRDSDFYWRDFQARSNNELADILGNFVNRTLQFLQKHFENRIPDPALPEERDAEFLRLFRATAEGVGALYESYKFREGVVATMNLARAANKYFNDSEPWKRIKSDRARCATTLHNCVQAVRALAVLFAPVIPETSARIAGILNLDPARIGGWNGVGAEFLPAGHRLRPPEILFRKIEDEAIAREMEKLSALPRPDGNPAASAPALKAQIGIEEFGRIDLRVATVIAAERVKKSDKLIKLQVDLGSEKRQIVAGIGKAYRPEDLVGREIVVVANLAPAKLFGVESQGMLLAASNADGFLTIVRPSESISPGSLVK